MSDSIVAMGTDDGIGVAQALSKREAALAIDRKPDHPR